MPIGRTTTAGNGFEALAAEHREFGSRAFDQPAALQAACCGGDANVAHAEHVDEKLLRHVEVVGVCEISIDRFWVKCGSSRLLAPDDRGEPKHRACVNTVLVAGGVWCTLALAAVCQCTKGRAWRRGSTVAIAQPAWRRVAAFNLSKFCLSVGGKALAKDVTSWIGRGLCDARTGKRVRRDAKTELRKHRGTVGLPEVPTVRVHCSHSGSS